MGCKHVLLSSWIKKTNWDSPEFLAAILKKKCTDYSFCPTDKSNLEDGPFGGDGGSEWSDALGFDTNGEITAIEIRSGQRVDAISTRYGDIFSETHGGSGGELQTIKFQPGEKIVSVLGTYL